MVQPLPTVRAVAEWLNAGGRLDELSAHCERIARNPRFDMTAEQAEEQVVYLARYLQELDTMTSHRLVQRRLAREANAARERKAAAIAANMRRKRA
jgi:hypothetical protein